MAPGSGWGWWAEETMMASEPMHDKRLSEIRRGIEVGQMEMDEDEAFWAIRDLLDEVARLRAERAVMARIAVEVARLDVEGNSHCECWRTNPRGHHDTCWVMEAHQIAHTTPSGEMDG